VITRDDAIAAARRRIRSERLKANRQAREKEERSGRTATGRTNFPLPSGVRILAVRLAKLERAAERPERWEGVRDVWHIHLEGDPPPARWKGGYSSYRHGGSRSTRPPGQCWGSRRAGDGGRATLTVDGRHRGSGDGALPPSRACLPAISANLMPGPPPRAEQTRGLPPLGPYSNQPPHFGSTKRNSLRVVVSNARKPAAASPRGGVATRCVGEQALAWPWEHGWAI
jgi:hypothetical protein